MSGHPKSFYGILTIIKPQRPEEFHDPSIFTLPLNRFILPPALEPVRASLLGNVESKNCIFHVWDTTFTSL